MNNEQNSQVEQSNTGGAGKKIVDMEDILDRFGDDIEIEFLYEIAAQSIESISNNLAKIEKIDLESDISGMSPIVHSMKGVASNLGATSLVSLALELEGNIKQGSIDDIRNKISEIQNDIQALSDFVSQSGWVEKEIAAVTQK